MTPGREAHTTEDAVALDVPLPPRPDRHGSAGQVLQYVLGVHLRELLTADAAVRQDQPDAVHRLRVAARTLRSVLRTFGPLSDGGWAARLRDELAVTAEAFGTVRDAEVLIARLEADSRLLPDAERVRALGALDAVLRPRLAAARAAALVELGSARHRRLVADLVDAARHPSLTTVADRDAADVLPDLVSRDWDRLVRAVRHLRRHHVDPHDPAWHRARILAKRVRYAVESSAPALHGGTPRWLAELPRVTDLLGVLHDGVVASDVVQQAADRADEATATALGRLLSVEAQAVDAAAEEFLEQWPKVRRTLERHPVA